MPVQLLQAVALLFRPFVSFEILQIVNALTMTAKDALTMTAERGVSITRSSEDMIMEGC